MAITRLPRLHNAFLNWPTSAEYCRDFALYFEGNHLRSFSHKFGSDGFGGWFEEFCEITPICSSFCRYKGIQNAGDRIVSLYPPLDSGCLFKVFTAPGALFCVLHGDVLAS